MADKPTLLVRDYDLRTVGEIDDYTSLTVTPTFNDVGSWQLELSAESAKVPLLNPRVNHGGGIVVLRGDDVIFSGPLRSFSYSEEGDPGSVTVSGPDDNVVLTERLVWPSPTAQIGSQGDFYTHAKADAETIMRDLVDLNVGPGALAGRRTRGLVLAPVNGHRGRVHVPAKMRFSSVLEELQLEAVAAQTGTDRKTQLGFRVLQVGNALEFQVFQSVDRIRYATFSKALGNLAGSSYTLTGPTANAVIVGVGNSPTDSGARINTNLLQYDRADTIWPHRVEQFQDFGEITITDAENVERADDAGEQALDQGAGQIGISMSPIDTEFLKFGKDYFIGDWVTVQTPFQNVEERVIQAGLTWTATEGEVFAAAVGTPDGTVVAPSSTAVDGPRVGRQKHDKYVAARRQAELAAAAIRKKALARIQRQWQANKTNRALKKVTQTRVARKRAVK